MVQGIEFTLGDDELIEMPATEQTFPNEWMESVGQHSAIMTKEEGISYSGRGYYGYDHSFYDPDEDKDEVGVGSYKDMKFEDNESKHEFLEEALGEQFMEYLTRRAGKSTTITRAEMESLGYDEIVIDLAIEFGIATDDEERTSLG